MQFRQLTFIYDHYQIIKQWVPEHVLLHMGTGLEVIILLKLLLFLVFHVFSVALWFRAF